MKNQNKYLFIIIVGLILVAYLPRSRFFRSYESYKICFLGEQLALGSPIDTVGGSFLHMADDDFGPYIYFGGIVDSTNIEHFVRYFGDENGRLVGFEGDITLERGESYSEVINSIFCLEELGLGEYQPDKGIDIDNGDIHISISRFTFSKDRKVASLYFCIGYDWIRCH